MTEKLSAAVIGLCSMGYGMAASLLRANQTTWGVDISPEQMNRGKCAGTSWILENRAPRVVAGDFAPQSSVDIWPRALGIVLDAPRAAKLSAPLRAAALQQFLAASGSGLGGKDGAAVAKVYARDAGLTLPGGA